MKRGFTLVEILISALILILITMAIVMIFNIGDKVFFNDSGLIDLQQDSRQAMDGMIREIRQAKQEALRPLSVTNNGGTVTFFIPNITNSISYSLQNGQIIRTHSGATEVLANNIATLSFCCEGGIDCLDCADSRFLQAQLQAQKTVNQLLVIFPSIPGAVGGQNLIEEVRLRQ